MGTVSACLSCVRIPFVAGGRLHEALGEPVAMSRLGSQLGMVLAHRIDKSVIPRTNGRLSVAGVNRTGLKTTTGAKSSPAAHESVYAG